MAEKLREFTTLQRHFEREKVADRPMRSKIEIRSSGVIGLDSAKRRQQLVVHDGEKQIVLNDRLSANTVFERGGEFKTFVSDHPGIVNGRARLQIVQFPSTEIDTLFGRLKLLHGMGLAVAFETLSLEEIRMWMAVTDRIEAIQAENQKEFFTRLETARKMESKIKTQDQLDAYNLKEFKSQWDRHRSKEKDKKGLNPTYKDFLNFLTFMVEHQREAWANALKLHRALKKEDKVDVLEGATNDEILSFIYRESLGRDQISLRLFLKDRERQDFMSWLKLKLGADS